MTISTRETRATPATEPPAVRGVEPGLPYTWWRVQAWATAEAAFPQETLQEGWFHDRTVAGACKQATAYWETKVLGDIQIVSVRRHPLNPPWIDPQP